MILLVDGQKPDDLDLESGIILQTLVDNNPNELMIVSQLKDQNYGEGLDDATKTLVGPSGFECVIDFSKHFDSISE